MLVELAIGDAYGAGFEYNSREAITRFNNLSKYIQHPKHKGTKPGMYTDDTQMSLAIAEAIVSGENWTKENLATRFVDCFKRDPREGYASRFYKFLQEVKDGREFLDRITPNSDKSGAAMRASPIGIYGSVDEVIGRATVQARITHDTQNGVNAAVAAALMTHYFIYDLGFPKDLGNFIETYVEGNWSDQWVGEVGSKGLMSVKAAITAVSRNTNIGDLLKDCINFSGDVDTVAAIALATASCSKSHFNNLPDNLYQWLENGDFGREYLKRLDEKLLGLVINISS